uniref:Putative NADH dehydrogenase [ubiquinone] 1 beta subcomplex subunit 2 n=1 Tax=Helianthus annuus TaxID=4232 RepID=A0A251RQM0_HELAN
MAGGHGYGNGTYKGVHLHQPKRWHTITGKGMCAMMWFWILYRAKQDGPVVLEIERDGDTLGKGTDMNMETNIRCQR